MFVLTAKMRVIKGKEQEFERFLREIVAKVRQNEKDTLLYNLHRKIGDPCEFFFYEQYTNREACQVTHNSAPYIKELLAKAPNFVEGGIELSEYELVEVD